MSDVTPYPTHPIDAHDQKETELVGSKAKFWLKWQHPDDPHVEWWMFKKPKNGWQGEDWSERVAADAARILGLPRAEYVLAVLRDREDEGGVLTREMFDQTEVFATLGNEFLTGRADVLDYPRLSADPGFRERQDLRAAYTPLLVLDALDQTGVVAHENPHGIERGSDLFIGYLLLDALLTNTDRHDENWGVLDTPDGRLVLMPTFDHASSMGRELKDSTRNSRLASTQSPHDLSAYHDRARSRFHHPVTADQISPLDVFALVHAARPEAARYWLSHLADLNGFPILDLLNRVPNTRITEVGRRFAQALVVRAERALLSLLR